MTNEEKELLARIVEGLLALDGRELSRQYSTELLDAAHLAGITAHMPGWKGKAMPSTNLKPIST